MTKTKEELIKIHKDFIHNLLSQTRLDENARCRKIVEGLKNTRILVVGSSNTGKAKTIGYHQALSDLLKSLQAPITDEK